MLKRVYLPVDCWEEISHNMWGEIIDAKSALSLAVSFTGDHALYGSYMRRVTDEWPNSCVNSLTDLSLNRKAWIGHAACALAHSIPESITRRAWGLLTYEQRVLANEEAGRAIQAWEDTYSKDSALHTNLEETLLFEWDT